ncbi:MEDS domain-containing protein [Aquipuribacter hungaricus]|uniref:MEDS domain-containing protein n=1 Tax=Aquipuribacter hungaricus TaxID=545624 RepID=A0ABV7WFK6_9MICO
MTAPTTRPHQVLLHDSGDGLAAGIASFLSVSLLRGEAALLLATPDHLAGAADALVAAGVDLDRARGEGRYVERDAAATLALFRTPDGIDADAFHAVLDPLLAELTGRSGAVAAYGEMVGLLAEEGDLAGAVFLEELWGSVTRTTPVRLLCGYAHGLLPGQADLDLVQGLHDTAARPVDATWALDLPAGPESAPLARAAVTDLCRTWGLDGTEWADDLVLVVAELVGNAVRHGGSRPTLAVDVHGGDVDLSVTDASDQLPAPRDDLLAENGRGYVIIDALSDSWGVERLPFGKRVWARLPLPRVAA